MQHILCTIDHTLDQILQLPPTHSLVPELKRFIIENELVITKADKTDTAVIMTVEDYFLDIHKNLESMSFQKIKESKKDYESRNIQQAIYDNYRYQDYDENEKPC